jgi:hypothetical protein
MINLIMCGRFPEKKRLEEFACNVVNHFFKRDRKEKITIAVEMKTNLDGNDAGYCVDFGNYNHGGRTGKVRTIAIALSRNYVDEEEEEKFPYTVREIASTLAHELVHAKQYIRRELSGPKLERGIALTQKKGKSGIKYRDLPWEKEAYGYEDELVELYW